MKMTFKSLIVLASILLLAGCGKKLTGTYTSDPVMPKLNLGVPMSKEMTSMMRKTEEMTRTTLEFKGSKVRIGNSLGYSEHAYKINGDKIEITVEEDEWKQVQIMTLNQDGTIDFGPVKFRKNE